MNNTVEWLFGFSKLKWLQYTGEVGKCTSYRCQIFSGFNVPKSLKSFNFWQSYLKNNKKGGRFLGHSVYLNVVTYYSPLHDELNSLIYGTLLGLSTYIRELTSKEQSVLVLWTTLYIHHVRKNLSNGIMYT